jgi:hypothetical protein
MFHQLIESGTRRRDHAGWTLASIEQQPHFGGETVVSGGVGIGAAPDSVHGRIYTTALVDRTVETRRGNGQPI